MAVGDFIQPDAFKARYTEFAELDDTLIDVYLLEARLVVDENWPEAARPRAQGLATAHQLTLEGKASAAGSGGSLSALEADNIAELDIEDDIRIKFDRGGDEQGTASSDADAVFAKTRYGQEFIALRARYFGGGIVV